jgi:ComF family protein
MFDKILDLLFPEGLVCCLCGDEAIVGERGICGDCAGELRTCADLPLIYGLDGVAAGLIYDDVTAPGLYRFKYGSARYLASFFASYMELPAGNIDRIVPVPLHKSKRRLRGYNQSELLANELSKRENIPCDTSLLSRIRKTGTQTKLSQKQREKNVNGAFLASPEARGLNILLIDDVITTGSTLRECAKALKKAGAGSVYALCACARES